MYASQVERVLNRFELLDHRNEDAAEEVPRLNGVSEVHAQLIRTLMTIDHSKSKLVQLGSVDEVP